MTITTVLDPPDPQDSLPVFNTKSFAFAAALTPWADEANGTAAAVNDDAAAAAISAAAALVSKLAAQASELAAANSAAIAAAAGGAPAWVSGATYAIGNPVWSPASNLVYRRRTVGAGVTDPSADPTNWALVAAVGLQMVEVAGISAAIDANTHTLMKNAAAWAATAPPAPSAGQAIELQWDNGRFDNTLDLGANGVKGPNGTVVTGVLTLNQLGMLRLRWWGDYWRGY